MADLQVKAAGRQSRAIVKSSANVDIHLPKHLGQECIRFLPVSAEWGRISAFRFDETELPTLW